MLDALSTLCQCINSCTRLREGRLIPGQELAQYQIQTSPRDILTRKIKLKRVAV
ncbi:hypothetical protein D3C76_1074510 [compost metagenome]